MTSPGVGGTSIGSHIRTEAFQQPLTAQDAQAKQGLIMVKDTIQMSFTQMTEARFKYANDPKRPLLPMFIQVSTSQAEKPDMAWVKLFDQMKENLPDDLKSALARQMTYPKESRDPRFEGLRRGLEFAAKGLYWLRGAAKGVTIDEKERRKRDEIFVEESLTHFKLVFDTLQKVITRLHPTAKVRPFLMQFVRRVPPILHAIGKRRGDSEYEIDTHDKRILQEIEEMRSYLKQQLGEAPLFTAYYLLDQLEVLHQLSYHGINLPLYKCLLQMHDQLCYSSNESSFIGKAISALGEKILSLVKPSIFDKERNGLINLMLTGVMSLFQGGTKEHDFGFRLIISMLIASRFVTKMGGIWLKGLLYSESESRLLTSALLGSSMGSLLVLTGYRALQDQEKEELLHVLHTPLKLVIMRLLKDLEGNDELSDFKVYARKVLKVLENHPQELFVEVEQGVEKLHINSEKFALDLEAANQLIALIRSQMEYAAQEEQKMKVITRAA